MPEMPEIEHLRRTLVAGGVIGSRVVAVKLHRRDVVRMPGSRKARRGFSAVDLLEGCVITDIVRRGKSLAIVGMGPERDGDALSLAQQPRSGRASPREGDGGCAPRMRVLVLHMGMTGSMRIVEEEASRGGKHVHCEWVMEAGEARSKGQSRSLTRVPRLAQRSRIGRHSSREGKGVEWFRLLFRDPRRFGGLWPFASMDQLHAHARGWSRLGPDAFDPPLDARTLRSRLLRTRQPIKAALLNQRLIAGVGNIYADEALFRAGIHPRAVPKSLDRREAWTALAGALRHVLEQAVDAGGSTIRDYVDANGEAGGYVGKHFVYGRGGQPCMRCGTRLRTTTIGQRTTVYCSKCQVKRGRV